jgi:hypothetical protein
LSELVSITEVINSRDRHKKIESNKGFHELREGIAGSAAELKETDSLLQEFEDIRITIQDLNNKNPLKQLIKEIATENGLYLECHYLLNMFKVVTQTSEKNLIEMIGKVNNENKKRKT